MSSVQGLHAAPPPAAPKPQPVKPEAQETARQARADAAKAAAKAAEDLKPPKEEEPVGNRLNVTA